MSFSGRTKLKRPSKPNIIREVFNSSHLSLHEKFSEEHIQVINKIYEEIDNMDHNDSKVHFISKSKINNESLEKIKHMRHKRALTSLDKIRQQNESKIFVPNKSRYTDEYFIEKQINDLAKDNLHINDIQQKVIDIQK